MSQDRRPTRRAALRTGLGILAAGSALATTRGARAQSAKADPGSVGYQTKPSAGAQCSGCVQWAPPSSCKIVSGTISPTGWCELYSPKS